MDKDAIIGIVKEYSMLVVKRFPVEQIVLYGSFAQGTAGQHSDIDLAVVVERIDGDYLEKQAELYKLRRNVDLRIEPILFVGERDDSGFLQQIRTTGEIIYGREATH